MTRTKLTIEAGKTFQIGRTYKATEANMTSTFKVVRFWGDREYGLYIGYETDDGQQGDSTPNSLFWHIDWEASNAMVGA